MPKMGRFGLLIGKAKVNNTPKKTTAQGGERGEPPLGDFESLRICYITWKCNVLSISLTWVMDT